MTERLIDLYTYLCVDGYTRTRCLEHIPRSGPYRPYLKKAYSVKRGVPAYHCCQCNNLYILPSRGGDDERSNHDERESTGIERQA